MSEMEKVIEGLENLRETIRTATQYTFTSGGICAISMKRIDNAIELLKEQEDLGTELTNAVELIHKKNERIEKLMKEQETSNLYKCPNCGTWVSAENVVRCKDCTNWTVGDIGTYCPYHHDARPDWFCADGKRSWKSIHG